MKNIKTTMNFMAIIGAVLLLIGFLVTTLSRFWMIFLEVVGGVLILIWVIFLIYCLVKKINPFSNTPTPKD